MTKKRLESYKRIKQEIPVLEYELHEMQTTDAGLGNSVILDYRDGFPRPQTVVGFDWKLYERRKETLDRKKEELKAIEAWIDSIEDGQTRCVFKMRYIDGMRWVKIAAKTGYGGSHDYPRKCIRDAYLKKEGIK